MIDSTTATIAPGTFGRNLLNPRMITSVPTANASVGRLVSPRWVSVVPLLLEPVARALRDARACRGSGR